MIELNLNTCSLLQFGQEMFQEIPKRNLFGQKSNMVKSPYICQNSKAMKKIIFVQLALNENIPIRCL